MVFIEPELLDQHFTPTKIINGHSAELPARASQATSVRTLYYIRGSTVVSIFFLHTRSRGRVGHLHKKITTRKRTKDSPVLSYSLLHRAAPRRAAPRTRAARQRRRRRRRQITNDVTNHNTAAVMTTITNDATNQSSHSHPQRAPAASPRRRKKTMTVPHVSDSCGATHLGPAIIAADQSRLPSIHTTQVYSST